MANIIYYHRRSELRHIGRWMYIYQCGCVYTRLKLEVAAIEEVGLAQAKR